MDLGIFTQRLGILDERKQLLGYASGFLVEGPGNLDYLYTCWHVVTGLNFLNLKFRGPPKPRFLRLEGLGTRKEVYGTYLGDQVEGTIALYLPDGKPRWEQQQLPHHQPNTDLNSIGIFVPTSLDVVKITLELPESLYPVRIPTSRCHNGFLHPLQDVILSGFPYGYSSLEDAPWPILLKRNVASSFPNSSATLLDAPGSPGMSGGPVWTSDLRLAGIYRGSIFPDSHAMKSQHQSNNKHAALGLMTHSSLFVASTVTNQYGETNQSEPLKMVR